MNKNKSFDCNGNVYADQILCMLEGNSVLSTSFTTKVTNIVLSIVSNLEGNHDHLENTIVKLKEEMEWIVLFNPSFTGRLIGMLFQAYHHQMALNKTQED